MDNIKFARRSKPAPDPRAVQAFMDGVETHSTDFVFPSEVAPGAALVAAPEVVPEDALVTAPEVTPSVTPEIAPEATPAPDVAEAAAPRTKAGVEMQLINIRLPRELAKAYKLFCLQNDLTMQDDLQRFVMERMRK